MQSFAMAADDKLDPAIAEDALFNYGKLQYELGGGAFNGAINVLTRYVGQYPDSPRVGEARSLLIAAYYNSNDYDAAYRAIKSFPTQDADIRAALQKITYFRGLEAYSAGDMRAAQRYLAESAAINVSPKYSALNSFWQGEIAFAQGDYTVAAAKYNAYLKRAPAARTNMPWRSTTSATAISRARTWPGRAVRSRSSSKPIRPATATAPMPTTGWATSAIPTANSKRP